MADSLPIDFSHPSVKEYVALIRLQVLTPLSTLVHVATLLATQFIISPSLGELADLYRTSITPKSSMVAVFFLALFAGQIGFCLLLVVAWKEDTKKAIVHGVGFPIVLTNWLMAGWAVAFSFRAFMASAILISLVVTLLIFMNIRLAFFHPAKWTQPVDYILLHAPLRLFLLLSSTLLLPLCIFLAMGHTWLPTDQRKYDDYAWEGFAVTTAAGVLATIVAAWRRDLVWSIGTIWILWCIGSERPKSAPVSGSIIAFTVVIPVTFFGFLAYSMLRRDEGRIRLEEGDLPRGQPNDETPRPPATQPGNHQVRTEDVWG